MAKTIVILQSNYIPWKGYFDLIRHADEFIFYDEVQYTHSDWRNRNKIKSESGSLWLTIPVGRNLDKKICQIETRGQLWKEKHRKTIHHNYHKAPFYQSTIPLLDSIYSNNISNLSDFNQFTIKAICSWMGINANFTDSRKLLLSGNRTEKLVEAINKVGGGVYLCGPASRNYLDEEVFRKAGIQIAYFNYSGYKEYPQFYPPFDHAVSILDLLLHIGPRWNEFL